MKKWKSACILALSAIVCFACFTGCKDPDAELKKNAQYNLAFWTAVSPASDKVLNDVIKTFNHTNTDGIYVTATPRADSSGIGMQLAGSNPPDVVYTEDRYFKGYALDRYLEPLDKYVEKSELVDLNDIWQSTVERFRFDPDTGYSGGDNTLYALPLDNDPTVIYYNKTQFAEKKINIISVAEEEIDVYNETNGTSYLPHGFYEYADSSAVDGNLTQNNDGKYYVFNNRIPMNWEELRTLAGMFVTGDTYGFMNEWWFSYGWSVGGDCLEWVSDPNKDGNDNDAQYMFSLGEKTPNYLVTKAITVNGNSYAARDLLSYDDKHYVEDHKGEATIAAALADKTLYPLPSIYDAFVEFCRLSQTTTKEVADGKNGYGISPTPTQVNQIGKERYFTSGKLTMLCHGLSAAYNMSRAIGNQFEWDVAPLYQYREYNVDGTLKTVNDTPVTGKKSAHNVVRGYAIPANSKQKDAAWKLIEYLASAEVQEKLIPAYLGVPARKSVAQSSAYLNWNDRFVPNNKAVLVEAADYCTVGDWSYIEDGEWINPWADVLNTSVRGGDINLDTFFRHSCITTTNNTLKRYMARKYNG
ncbi:MAG: extracellular solute-binding protein [Clostridiales bacterium]|nr:extracellular solute-binding protein [Clostridiales bacterium]